MMYVATNEDALSKYLQFVELFKDRRYLIDQNHDFIKYYLSGLTETTHIVNKGQIFFRARINELKPFQEDKDLQAPPEGTASIGRVNPKGISYLYVAENIETVIAEVQPWLNACITIAECTALETLNVVDLIPSEEERSRQHSYRKVISREFSKPVRPDTKELDYVPTQYIAEWFKNTGLDGLRYESALHFDGINLALFDPSKFQVKRIEEVTVTGVAYSNKLSRSLENN